MAIITDIGIGPEFEEQNEVVKKWASMVQRNLRTQTNFLTHGKEGTVLRSGRTERKLTDSIRTESRKTNGIITGQSFKFELHGIWLLKGVGKGYVINPPKSPVKRTAKEKNPQRERTPYDWFNPVIQPTLPELADKLAEINADAAVNATRMMIR